MIVIACIMGVCVFVACVFSFSIGFKFGLSVKNGDQPKIEPAKKVEKKTPLTEFDEGLRNILMYNGMEDNYGTDKDNSAPKV